MKLFAGNGQGAGEEGGGSFYEVVGTGCLVAERREIEKRVREEGLNLEIAGIGRKWCTEKVEEKER